MKPKSISQAAGFHNLNPGHTQTRLVKGQTYSDLSTVCIIPTRGMIHAKVLQSWFGVMSPMNQKFHRLFVVGMEVGDAYSTTIEQILAEPALSKFKYLATMEDDNIPPPDGWLRLYESIEGKVDGVKYDAVGGLYWTKGECGQPMIYGNPQEHPKTFVPQLPIPNSVQRCNGLGMGFNLYRMSMFKDKDLPRPLFKTAQEYVPGVGSKQYTQDLYFYENAGKLGYKFACDTRVLVGHYDHGSDTVW